MLNPDGDSIESTLEGIEGDNWGDPPPGSTRLVATIHSLRRKSISALGVEDLRVMVSQKIVLSTLVPVALDVLMKDPLVGGDFYPGDLLVAVLRVPSEYWEVNEKELMLAKGISNTVDRSDPDVAEAVGEFLLKFPEASASG